MDGRTYIFALMEALEFLKLSKHHLASKKEIKKFSQVDGKMRYLNDLIFEEFFLLRVAVF